MNLITVVVLCSIITLALIVLPLFISRKAEIDEKKDDWGKIADYGNKINKKTRKKFIK